MACQVADGVCHNIEYLHLLLKRTLKAGLSYRIPCSSEMSVQLHASGSPAYKEEHQFLKWTPQYLLAAGKRGARKADRIQNGAESSSLTDGSSSYVKCSMCWLDCSSREDNRKGGGWPQATVSLLRCSGCIAGAQLKNVFGLCWLDSHKQRRKRELSNKFIYC